MPRVSEDQSAAGYLQSNVAKRSLIVGGHRTSVSLEDVFWNGLRAIAKERRVHLSELVAIIDDTREHANLSSAIRLFVFEHRTGQQIAHSNISAR